VKFCFILTIETQPYLLSE